MLGTKYSREEQEALDALWLSNLSHIKTFYGRLVYLAGLRNPDTGRYEHYGLTLNSTAGSAHRAFRRIHETIFREWVRISLEQKKADVEAYIAGIDQVNVTELIDAWLRLTPYKNLVPASIQGPERHQHISDFEAILGLLKNLYGVASPDPNA
ncbi:MAG TPA: hypothetical protein VG168_08595 [Bryobacteraceae bacterium]|jgi:hypothetical protein|nr:hypothetical protein [Bryobacteraceae bacterium]